MQTTTNSLRQWARFNYFALGIIQYLSFTSCEFTCTLDRHTQGCGYYGIQQEECESRDCCWNSNVPPGTPWCFHKNGGYKYCSNSAKRSDCGMIGITKEQCDNRGCCWDPVDNVPWCFYPNTNIDPAICPYNDRQGCGYYSIKQDECEAMGCCWSPLEEGSQSPWCFRSSCHLARAKSLTNSSEPLDTCCSACQRIDCGNYGIQKEECESKNCCWDPAGKESSLPWCYFKNCQNTSSEFCNKDAPRTECGYYGIEAEECKDKGCCWSPLEPESKAPWCFFRNGDKLTPFATPSIHKNKTKHEGAPDKDSSVPTKRNGLVF